MKNNIRNLIFVLLGLYVAKYSMAGTDPTEKMIRDGDNTAHFEMTIDRPLNEVWPHAREISKWMSYYTYETVSGEANKEGQVVKIINDREEYKDTPLPHYHFYKVVKIVPMHKLVLKVFSEEGGSYGMDMLTYDVLRAFEHDGKTTVMFDVYTSKEIRSLAQGNISGKQIFIGKQNITRQFESYWKNLIALVDQND